MILDPLRPYLAAIRIIGYILIVGFLFTSGCSYGKRVSANKLYKAETDLAVCRDANQNNVATIKTLQDANAQYATQGAKQSEKVAQAVKDAKAAEKRAQAQEKAFNKELQRAYKNNPDWSGAIVPDDVKRLLQRTD
jgi:phospholipase/lecithinase/hemolysin